MKKASRKRRQMPARATVAGYQVAAGTIESAHLMYQNRTALNFLMGVKRVIDREVRERKAALKESQPAPLL